jgi:hypothetical protein
MRVGVRERERERERGREGPTIGRYDILWLARGAEEVSIGHTGHAQANGMEPVRLKFEYY